MSKKNIKLTSLTLSIAEEKLVCDIINFSLFNELIVNVDIIDNKEFYMFPLIYRKFLGTEKIPRHKENS